MHTDHRILALQQRLNTAASAKTKSWWERYLRGAAAFRGVGIPQIRDILRSWRQDTGVADLPADEQLEVAFALFEVPITEDKQAGILWIQEYLRQEFAGRDLLPRFARLYAQGLIADWNTNDWFCVKVLGPTLREEGLPYARALARWQNAKPLWQARSAAVPFIAVAAQPQYYPLVATVCRTLLRREERFAKTAVGWVLRDISRHDTGFVRRFVKAQLTAFSLESLRNATKYFPAAERTRLAADCKSRRN